MNIMNNVSFDQKTQKSQKSTVLKLCTLVKHLNPHKHILEVDQPYQIAYKKPTENERKQSDIDPISC
ncbi:hypothetical protein L2E82_31850 [Cichorium intybus]|uniref:Uncharacterized protein n=1 Tax=Cichorium intybus TaxID=13427 RepID=A0ACB9BFK7_CICIN|nr:hypothetical protein L2E82_31850 [Cichorium intybus]